MAGFATHLMLGAVDFHALGQVIWISVVAGIGITVLFSFAIYSFARAADARRDGEGFGDFCHRLGQAEVQSRAEVPPATSAH